MSKEVTGLRHFLKIYIKTAVIYFGFKLLTRSVCKFFTACPKFEPKSLKGEYRYRITNHKVEHTNIIKKCLQSNAEPAVVRNSHKMREIISKKEKDFKIWLGISNCQNWPLTLLVNPQMEFTGIPFHMESPQDLCNSSSTCPIFSFKNGTIGIDITDCHDNALVLCQKKCLDDMKCKANIF